MVLAVCAAWPASARAAEPPPENVALDDRPKRQGFTLELGIGGALTFVTSEVVTETFCFGSDCPAIRESSSSTTVTDTYGGIAPLSLGIGGFVSPEFALLFRATGSSYFRGNDQWVNALYGGVVQYWPSDVIMLSAGAGATVLGRSSFYGASSPGTRSGFGFSLRAGVAVANYTHHSLRFATEVLPAFYDRRSAVGTTLVFEWQYF
jgi:hypothetical protein